MIAPINESSSIEDFVPIPSTSKAPLHLTFEKKGGILQLSARCDMQWFKCNAHFKPLAEYLFNFLSKLFIRKSCKIINSDFAKTEIDIVDKIKKAQQQNKDV